MIGNVAPLLQGFGEADDGLIAAAKEVPFGDQDADQTLLLGGPSRERIGLQLLDQEEVDEAFGPLVGKAVDLFGGDRLTGQIIGNSMTAQFPLHFGQGGREMSQE